MPFDFEKNGTVEDISVVPEDFRGLYVEKTNDDGKTVHVVSDVAKNLVGAYVGTNKALNQARADKKAASDEAASRRVTKKSVMELAADLGLENVDDAAPLAALKSYIEELTDKVKGGAELKINLDKIKAEAQKRVDEANASKDTEISELRADLYSTKVSDVATRAVTEAKGSIELLQPIIERQCKVVKEDGRYQVRVIDAQGDFRSDGQGGWMGVKALVAELKASEKYARAFDSETPGGSGARPGSGQKVTMRKPDELSSVGKIAQGLKKGQHIRGAGGQRIGAGA